ncbi:MAG: AMP-binding protein, partial [Actinomycetes bacterium]
MSQTLENLLREDRTFPPPPEFAAGSVTPKDVYDRAKADPDAYWLEAARTYVTWFKEPTVVLDDSNPPFYKWFTDGELNVSYNCLDRHLPEHAGKVAYHWVGEPGDTRTVTYGELAAEVNRFANALKGLGLQKGDRVAIYMGMVPELPVAMLACARLGIIHSVVFGGFSADALASRILDADARVLVTQDGAWRGGNIVPLKANADRALQQTPGVEKVIVLERTGHGVDMTEGRDVWWHDFVEGQSDECEPEVMNAEDPLYILYTSGTTGKPKGIVHTQGGYLAQVAATHEMVFDLKPDSDVYWCAADIGWVTGHSYIVYGPL